MVIEKVAVIGAGTMGHGIAQVAAQAGFDVVLEDVSADFVGRGYARIEDNLRKGVERGKITEDDMRGAISRIRTSTNLEEAVAAADLVIEAVVEKIEAKRDLFSQLDRAAKPHAILATNTSSLSIAAIASATGRADRVIGMHFFNPVHIMKLIEVVIASETSEETLGAALGVSARMGKEAITVKDVPGFATSRLGVALGLEAMRMLEQGVASAEDIDKAMALGYNHPMGPLRLTDLVGLDIRLNIAEYLFDKLASEVFRPPDILKRKVAEGKLGKKTGEGFYKWE
ncbi:MAG TPA: 3-hydroxyacyl-CoA dehydrogenase family protein [Blastocatellia bacterium]|jgi:3-hydroxybutyryl-CoA dehydrogenase|nr:3-hydroxyacyl-CoA dehydrogenase family protein [Blastocatellia bacterium]